MCLVIDLYRRRGSWARVLAQKLNWLNLYIEGCGFWVILDYSLIGAKGLIN